MVGRENLDCGDVTPLSFVSLFFVFVWALRIFLEEDREQRNKRKRRYIAALLRKS
jgi:hypothetical protein